MSAAIIDISEYQDDDIISTARESMGIGGVIIRLVLLIMENQLWMISSLRSLIKL